MTTTTAPAPATEAQIKYVSSLLSERVSDALYASAMADVIAKGELSRRDASKAIDYLNTQPRKPRDVVGADPRRAMITEMLAALPKARYAIPTADLPVLFSQRVTGDLLFIRLSEYRGRQRLVRLHGAPGYFSTTAFGMGDALMIAKLLEDNALRYTQLFASHYSVCGKCLAELTDQTSRERGLGPVCAKGFGY